MLYSIGKDSSVLLHLAIKAFYPSHGLLADPLDESVGHAALFVHMRQVFIKGLATMLAAPATGFNVDRGPLAEARQILDDLLTSPETYHVILAAMLAVCGLISELGVDMEVVIFLHYAV